MESIGEKLRQAREEQGYTLDQVARDTHIAKRFIEALEEEDFDVFPGEPYLLGFLRTYAEFLELDPQEIVTLYKNLKLQEQPAPMDELLVKRRSPKPYVITAAVAVAVALVAFGVFLLATSERAATPEGRSAGPVPASGESYTLAQEILEQRFDQGDVINVPVGSGEFPIVIESVADRVTLTTPGGARGIAPGEEQILDLNEDGRGDLRFLVRQVDAGTTPPSAVLRLDRVVESPNVAARSPEDSTEPSVGAETDTEPVGSTQIESRREPSRLIVRDEEPRPFTVQIAFQGATLFRYEADGARREEQFVQNGDSFQTDVEREFRIWLSNAGAARMQVAEQELELGSPGEVTAELVTWVQGEQGGPARLELIPMY